MDSCRTSSSRNTSSSGTGSIRRRPSGIQRQQPRRGHHPGPSGGALPLDAPQLADPVEEDAPAFRVQQGPRAAEMAPFPAHAPVDVRVKPFLPDLADVVLASLQVAAEEQHVPAAEREEIGHGAVLASLRPLPARLVEQAGELPVPQVRRSEQVRRVPPVLRVAFVDGGVVEAALQPAAGVVDGVAAEAGVPLLRLRDHRVARVLRPLEQQVAAAAGEAEAVGIAVVDQGRNPFPVDQGPAAEAADAVRSVILGRQRHRMVDPVHEVGAGGVPPLDAVPVGPVRVELVEDVVAPLPVDGAVDVVHPGGGRREVPGRPVRVAGQGGSEIAGLPDPRFHPLYLVFSSHG